MKIWDYSRTVGYYRILQIMAPSIKMKAVYKSKDGVRFEDPVACFALLECVDTNPGKQDIAEFIENNQDSLEFSTDIIPMVIDKGCGFFDIANDLDSFVGYEFV